MMQSIAAAAPVVPGVDITSAYGLKAFLAHKFKKKFWDITDNTNVHDLAAGKYSTSTVVKMLSAKLPGGFSASQLRAYMTQERFFGPKRIEIAMIHSLANAPDARFATEADAKTWINLVIDEYGSVSSAMIPFATKAGGAVSAGVPMMGGGGSISSAALDALKAQMHTMMREQVKAYQAFMKFDPLATLKKTNADKVSRREKHNDLWVSEHGEYYEKGIQPKFDAKKIRIYSSYWNWVMQDALDLYYRTYANAQGESEEIGVFDRDSHLAQMSAFLNTDSTDLASMGEPETWHRPFLCNHATPELLAATEFFIARQQANGNSDFAQAIQLLNDAVEKWLERDPVHGQLLQPYQPRGTIEANDTMSYKAEELSRGFHYRSDDFKLVSPKSGHSAVNLIRGIESADLTDDGADSGNANSVNSEPTTQRRSAVRRGARANGSKLYGLKAVLRKAKRAKSFGESFTTLPYVHVRKNDERDPTLRVLHEGLTKELLLSMPEIATGGVSFVGKNALVTGCGNNFVSAGVEKLGVCTFNQVEMAFHLTSILHPRMVAAAAKSPLWVDSGGGMARLHDLKVQTDNIRAAMTEESKIRRASVEDRTKDSVTDVVDAAKPVWNRDNMYYADTQVKSLYEENILKHSGIRVIEPELFEGYDPKKKIILQQVDKNMRPIEVASREEGLDYQKELGDDNCDVFDDSWIIRLRQGAVLSIPKNLHLNRWAAGQIPTGWDAKRCGIPANITEAVDPITLFTLVSTTDALLSAGITDPRSLRCVFLDRANGINAPSDTIEETFINTPAAWVNMLLLSSSGPIKTHALLQLQTSVSKPP
ncbi:unnamed protein product [Aphanomyces euteiches]